MGLPESIPLKSEQIVHIRLEGAPTTWSIVPSMVFLFLFYRGGVGISFYAVWAVILFAPALVISKALRIGNGLMVCGYAIGRMMIYRLWSERLDGSGSVVLDTGRFPSSGESNGGKAFILKLDLGKTRSSRTLAVLGSETKANRLLGRIRVSMEPFIS